MSRIKIQLPETFHLSFPIPIRITDLNYGGHVGNDTFLSLMHEARVQYLHHFGYTELEFAGVSLIMADAGIEFRAELFYGDQLKAYVAADNFSRVGFDLYYKLVKGKEEIIVGAAKTAMICYDYKSRKVVALPEEAKKLKMQNEK